MLIERGTQLARAKYLVETTNGVRIAHGKKQVTYIHLMFERPETTLQKTPRPRACFQAPWGCE